MVCTSARRCLRSILTFVSIALPTSSAAWRRSRRHSITWKYFRIGCWREPARPQHGNAIAAIHLDLRRIAKVRANRRRERDETTRRKQRHAANQRWLIDCQTGGAPVAKGGADQVRRTPADRLNDASDITGQILQGRAIEETELACRT